MHPARLRLNLQPSGWGIGSCWLSAVYSGQGRQIKVRLEANEGIEVHPYIQKPAIRGPVEFDIPREATQGGQLTLRWQREPGHAGVGTGSDVSEVWLIKLCRERLAGADDDPGWPA